MNYLLDRKAKYKKIIRTVLLIIIFTLSIYFRSGILGGLSYATHVIFRPVIILGDSIGEKISSIGAFFMSRKSLQEEIENLKESLAESEGKMFNYNSVFAENISLKEILGRLSSVRTGGTQADKTSMILGVVMSKPNSNPYDTLVIDIGSEDGVRGGNMVFALGNIPLGIITETFPKTSKVTLFSTSGVKTQVLQGGGSTEFVGRSISQAFFEIVGRGGGNFEMILPRNFSPIKGDEVVLPGIIPYVLAKVETVISDPREPFVKALLVSPVNIQETKFVQVSIQN